MTENESETRTGNESENAKKPPGRTRAVVRIVLFTILAVMIWRLIHDRLADKQYRAACERVDALQEQHHASPGQIKTGPAEVRGAIGHDSATGKPEAVDHYYREDFHWQRGLPWMRYFICVIYRDVDGKPKFHGAFQGYEPGDEELPVKKDVYWERVEAAINSGQKLKPAPVGTDDTDTKQANPPDSNGPAAGDAPAGINE